MVFIMKQSNHNDEHEVGNRESPQVAGLWGRGNTEETFDNLN